MFMDFRDPPPRWEPLPKRPAGPNLTAGQVKALGWIVLLNVVMVVVAPIGGASIVSAIIVLLR
jgi:hypothetical protein